MKTLFKNANLVFADSVVYGWLIAENGKISALGEGDYDGAFGGEVFDCLGAYLSPGFIDTHIHGGAGFDFMDAVPEEYEKIAAYHASNGVTTMLATTLAGDREETKKVLSAFNEASKNISCCNLLGVHLEGPYFSPLQKGAQDPKYIKEPDMEEAEEYLSFGCIRRWSVAPELSGAIPFGKYLSDRKVIVSVAHTDADYYTVKQAHENGYSLMTHLYSGMSQARIRDGRRVGGAVEAGLLLDDMYVELICDGFHLTESVLQLILKCKGPDKIILTSDAMRGAGLPEGSVTKLGSRSRGQEVKIYGGVAHTMDGTAFAGSVASGNRLLKTILKNTSATLPEGVRMLTKNPAEILEIQNQKGSLAVGFDADLVLFDEDINIIRVMNGGKLL
ncbi:MAG: N-acetylglucosamine-6-phosphate deacetylase [Clostridia bacterium]|nr:N-acetylglucosamine-6-phosphate deacetylase [Clostridia bacterium]